MKKIILITVSLLVMSAFVFGQEKQKFDEKKFEKAMEKVDRAMEKLETDLEKIPESSDVKVIKIEKGSGNTPKMGVYLSDLDFQDAYEMHYPYCYGALITGVNDDGPAKKAGLIEGDIVMKFDGVKVKYEDHLVKLIHSKSIGDVVKVVAFRDENIIEAELELFSPKRESEEAIVTKDGKVKTKLSVGGGGGSWIPVWYAPKDEFEDINTLLDSVGFNLLDEKGIFTNGFGGKGNVGKGWFLGGMGTWYSIDKKRGYTTTNNMNVTRRMNYSFGYGGVTLDKRLAISKKLITSLGFMLGWGGHELEVSQTDGSYNWNEIKDNLEASDNNTIKISRDYIMFQPKVMMMYRILDWLGIRAEAGYLLSHSFTSGWNANSCGDTFEVNNSPDTSFDGYTISIGPWFGF